MRKYVFVMAVFGFSFNVMSGDMYTDAAKSLYDIFFGKTDVWQIIDENGNEETINNVYRKTDKFIESGVPGSEPDMYLFGQNLKSKWSAAHLETCVNSNMFQKMPITSPGDGYETYRSLSGISKNIKVIEVQNGVPISFKSKTHGGATNILSDSFYFWSYGDGIRRFNINADDEETAYVYDRVGEYLLSSIVYSEEISVFIGVTGSLNGDFSLENSKIDYGINDHGLLYLEGCDIAKIKVLPNHAPIAKIGYGVTGGGGTGPQIIEFYSSSTDPDGNPLSYTWKNGSTVVSNSSRYRIAYGAAKTIGHNNPSASLTLIVTDGGLSDITSIRYSDL